MESWVKGLLEKERVKRKLPLEVKLLNNNYYLYRSTSRWDSKEKKPRKVTEYIGRMTREGVIEKNAVQSSRSVFEFGNSQLLLQMSESIRKPLQEAFPLRWKELLGCGLVKTLQPLPLRLINSRWEKLAASHSIDASLSPSTVSKVLHEAGKDLAAQNKFFDSLMSDTRLLAFDLSSVFSHSENLLLAEKGYNPEHLFLRQINLMLFFSIDKQLPVMMSPLHGSVRDVKALKNAIEWINSPKLIIVLDRGFASYNLAELLNEKSFNFIIPLKRNFSIINYKTQMKNSFIYRERGIKWNRYKAGENFVYLFEDVKLRAEEETTFITLMGEKKKKRHEYEEKIEHFGKIAILSNLDIPGEKIYDHFKNREDIETSFDALKNELENDKTYLRDDDGVRGYFFISFISLYIYYKILNLLRKKKLTDKISVNEALLELSKIYEIKINNKTMLNTPPSKAEQLAKKLDINLIPKP